MRLTDEELKDAKFSDWFVPESPADRAHQEFENRVEEMTEVQAELASTLTHRIASVLWWVTVRLFKTIVIIMLAYIIASVGVIYFVGWPVWWSGKEIWRVWR